VNKKVINNGVKATLSWFYQGTILLIFFYMLIYHGNF